MTPCFVKSPTARARSERGRRNEALRLLYGEGDLVSQRRFKEGVDAIPYEGEVIASNVLRSTRDRHRVRSRASFRTGRPFVPEGRPKRASRSTDPPSIYNTPPPSYTEIGTARVRRYSANLTT
jgi:hypothetical protein